MCGIAGIVAQSPVSQDIYDALISLQHRGQDAAGVMTSDGRRVMLCKGKGLVREVVTPDEIQKLQGHIALGHVRYPTAGSHSPHEAQPFYVNFPYGIVMVHNGNLVNTSALEQQIVGSGRRHLNTRSDSELLLNVLADELSAYTHAPLNSEHIFAAVRKVRERCQGAYSVIAMIAGHGVLAFRDQHGIRPLMWGEREQPSGQHDFMISSESVTLQTLGYRLVDDVPAGGSVFFDLQGHVYHETVEYQDLTPCIFEYIYLARPDSILNGVSVYQSRLAMGARLADRIQQHWSCDDIDVVMPIPETSCVAAFVVAQALAVSYCEGFVKSRYVGRTFIMPEQQLREQSVRRKLNTIDGEFKDKTVLLIDDSIVRGTTSKQVIAMARQAGARKVYFASVAPPVVYPNVYGIDMPRSDDLIAACCTTDEDMAEAIGADRVIFQTLEGLYAAMKDAGAQTERFEDGVFTGRYATDPS